MLRRMRVVGAAARAHDIPGITEQVTDGSMVQLGDVSGEVWLTEGHLDGHISFIMDGVLFCGDTLFGGGCGRLFDGPPEKMHRSLQRLAYGQTSNHTACRLLEDAMPSREQFFDVRQQRHSVAAIVLVHAVQAK